MIKMLVFNIEWPEKKSKKYYRVQENCSNKRIYLGINTIRDDSANALVLHVFSTSELGETPDKRTQALDKQQQILPNIERNM